MGDFASILNLNPQQILTQVHNSYVLVFGTYRGRITEAEYYGCDDPFTHGNDKQKECGTFYVHRTGTSLSSGYKGGSFKGMDITIGDGKRGGGILIRSLHIAQVQDDEKVLTPLIHVEGPCLVVNKICELTGWSLPDLEMNMRLEKCDWKAKKSIIFGTRGGLTLKRAPHDKEGMDEWARWLVRPYRSATFLPKKYKECFFAANIERTDIPSTIVDKYKTLYNQGRDSLLSRNMDVLSIAGYVSQLD